MVVLFLDIPDLRLELELETSSFSNIAFQGQDKGQNDHVLHTGTRTDAGRQPCCLRMTNDEGAP